MADQEVLLYGSDQRAVTANGEWIRPTDFMPYTEVSASADAGTDIITASNHGLINQDRLLVLGTVPGGLTAGQHYFVRDITTNTFKLATSPGGSAIDITAANGPWTYIKQLWTRLRIGIRCTFDGASVSLSGTPVLILGVCKGTSATYTDPTSEHVVGVRTQFTDWTYNAGPPPYFSAGPGHLRPFKRVGSTITETSQSVTFRLSADSSIRSAYFIEIYKGTLGTTWSFATAGPNASAGAQSDVTDAEFDQMMELAADFSGMSSVKSNYGALYTAVNLAVNENTDGVVDNLFVHWNRTSPKLTWDIKFRAIQ